MSIINDALKKATEEKDKAAKEPEIPQQQPVKDNSPDNGPSQKPQEINPQPSAKKEGAKEDNSLSTVRKRGSRVIFLMGIIAVILISTGVFLVVGRQAGLPGRQAGNTEYGKLPQIDLNQTIVGRPENKVIPGASGINSKQPASPAIQNQASDISGFELTGIVHGEGAPMAIINGGVYMVGDTIENATLLEISKNRVILEKDNNRIELKVK